MNTYYIESIEEKRNQQIEYKYNRNFKIRCIADSFDSSSFNKIYEVVTPVLQNEINLDEYSRFINKIDAHLIGKILQPNRVIHDEIIDEDVAISFELLDLKEAKKIKITEISNKTSELIYQGYTHTFNNGLIKTFPLSPINQSNWLGTQNQLNMGNITNDFPTTTIEGETFLIPIAELGDFMNCIFNHINNIRMMGRLYKNNVFNSESITDISAIVDTR